MFLSQSSSTSDGWYGHTKMRNNIGTQAILFRLAEM